MLSILKGLRQACWKFSFLLMIMISPILAANDRIDTPSMLSNHASEGLLLDIAQAGERLVAVGDQGRIIVSDDQGTSWRQIQTPVSVLLTAVCFSDAMHGWAVGHDGVVIHTQDGAETWYKQLDGRQLNQLRLDTYQALVDAGGDPQTPALPLEELEMYLDDAAIAVEEGPTQPLLDVVFLNNRQGFLLGAYGLLMTTEDGGSHWSVLSQRLPNPDRFHLNALFVDKQIADQKMLIIAGEAGALFRSEDQGVSWIELASPYEGSFFGLSSYQSGIDQQKQLLALGLRGHLFTSRDKGDLWQQVPLATSASLVSAATHNGEIMLVGQGGLVLHGRSLDQLKAFDAQDRRAWSAVARVNNGWVLVGEKGVKKVSDQALESNYE